MNVLIFVISMLVVLSLLTYGRVESFRHFAIVQSEFENYMAFTARKDVNEMELYRYLHTHVPSRYLKQSNPPNPASSTLSFSLFVDKDERAQHPTEFEAFRQAAKNLMQYLYGNQPFLKKIEEHRPQILDDIIEALVKKSDDFSDKEKITRPVELATIDLGNDDLNTAFTYMLEGLKQIPETTPEGVVEVGGYPSLLDYITIKKKKLTIRVFLASRPVLTALFGKPDVVNHIIESRNALYKDAKNKRKEIPQASEEFKRLFLNQRLPNIPDAMLNFDVSLTNPKTYE